MKRNILITMFVMVSLQAFSQQNVFTISGGYSFATIEDTDIKGTGYRINGLFEFNPNEGKFAHGFSIGFIGLKAEDAVGQGVQYYTINSFPIYYAPKVMFGSDKVKLFIKGALGTQIAGLKKEGLVTFSDTDFGFYGGGGAGVMLFIKSNIFINAEYEIAYASNGWYKDGWMNTAMGGLGFKF